MKSDKILVLGASGYIGSKLKAKFLENDYVTLGLGRHETNDFEIDLRTVDTGHLSSIFNEFDVVIGASWFVDHTDYKYSSENLIWREIYNERIFGALSNSKVRHFIGLGSCLEYGIDPAGQVTTYSPTITDTLYAECKYQVYKKFTNQLYKTRFSWLRLFYVYGGDENPRKLIPSLRRKISTGDPFEFHNPDIVNDYVHVDHVAESTLKVLQTGLTGLQNIGSGRPTRNGDLYSIMSGNFRDRRLSKKLRGHYCSDSLMTDHKEQFRP